jgi:hypothetical protein
VRKVQKTKIVLLNAVSLSMIPEEWTETTLRVRKVSLEEVKKMLTTNQFESAIGHEATANFLTSVLGIPVKAERKQVTFQPDTLYVVFQIVAGRLPEGRVLTEEELRAVNYRFYTVEVC